MAKMHFFEFFAARTKPTGRVPGPTEQKRPIRRAMAESPMTAHHERTLRKQEVVGVASWGHNRTSVEKRRWLRGGERRQRRVAMVAKKGKKRRKLNKSMGGSRIIRLRDCIDSRIYFLFTYAHTPMNLKARACAPSKKLDARSN